MRKKIMISAVLLVCALMLTGCMCEHEWTEATCTSPKTCSKCEATEGEALGHVHGELVEESNIVACEVVREQLCKSCGEQMLYEVIKIETLSQNYRFIFSPEDFMERMVVVAKKQGYDDCYYTFFDNYGALMAALYLHDTDSMDAYVTFFSDTNVSVRSEDYRTSGIWCVALGQYGTAENQGMIISEEMAQLFYFACDPLVGKSDYDSFVTTKMVAAFMSTDSEMHFAYLENHGLLYEFGTLIYGVEDEAIALESINAYAANWRNHG